MAEEAIETPVIVQAAAKPTEGQGEPNKLEADIIRQIVISR